MWYTFGATLVPISIGASLHSVHRSTQFEASIDTIVSDVDTTELGCYKLLGYDFEIVYKEGVNNRAANALSRHGEDDFRHLYIAHWIDWPALLTEVREDVSLAKIISNLEMGRPTPKHYAWVRNTLLYKGRILFRSLLSG